jgi:hypothetical protein
VENRKQSALDESEEPEPEPIERTTIVLKLSEGLRVNEAGIRLSAETDYNEQLAAAASGQRIMRMIAFLF